VLVEEEILGAKLFDRGVQHVVIEQDRAKHGALSVEVVGQRAFESEIGGHSFRFLFADYRAAGAQAQACSDNQTRRVILGTPRRRVNESCGATLWIGEEACASCGKRRLSKGCASPRGREEKRRES